MDINTPSVPVMFGGEQQPRKKLHLFSIGFDTASPITYTGKVVRKVLNSLAKKVTDLDPDVCIMDMPPGTSDIHLEVCTKLNPSSFILVTQPNKLSEEDALRATKVFMTTNIPIAGIIKNMSGEVFGKPEDIDILGLPVLATLQLDKTIAQAGSEGRIHRVRNNPLAPVCEDLLKEASDVSWKTIKTSMFEGPDFNTLSRSETVWLTKQETLKFHGTNSWDEIRSALLSKWGPPDDFLLYNDAETIRRMINGLDDDLTGLFMVIRPPRAEITTFPGEVGIGRLIRRGEQNTSYYGVPRIAYATDDGELTLFPGEVSPITTEKLLSLQNSGDLVLAPKSKTQRYVPPADVALSAAYAFNLTVPDDIEEHYKKLGVEV